ncbi:MAG: hypothetical protein SGI77_18270 [Pirellulaceae bacterium]|nr:hypothetical protein [Pirellulaceae bacterium]
MNNFLVQLIAFLFVSLTPFANWFALPLVLVKHFPGDSLHDVLRSRNFDYNFKGVIPTPVLRL